MKVKIEIDLSDAQLKVIEDVGAGAGDKPIKKIAGAWWDHIEILTLMDLVIMTPCGIFWKIALTDSGKQIYRRWRQND